MPSRTDAGAVDDKPAADKKKTTKTTKRKAEIATPGNNGKKKAGKRKAAALSSGAEPTTKPSPLCDRAKKPAMETAHRSNFAFRSDVPSAQRETHQSGMVHAIRHSFAHGREEHAFAWMDLRNDAHAAKVVNYLARCGYTDAKGRHGEGKVVFVPFSSRARWVHRYPHACPFVACDENGTIEALPYPPQVSMERAPKPADPGDGEKDGRQRRKRLRRGIDYRAKLLSSASLFDKERSQLHHEIYAYLAWLHSELADLGRDGGSHRIGRAGISMDGLEQLLEKLEGTFQGVAEFKASEEARKRKEQEEAAAKNTEVTENNGETDNGGEAASGNDSEKENAAPAPTALPMLETCLEAELAQAVDEADQRRHEEELAHLLGADRTQEPASNKQTYLAFDAMFDRLVAYKEAKGDLDFGHRYKDGDVHLGRWAADLRARKRELRKRKLEHEPPVEKTGGADGGDADDVDFIALAVSPGRLGLTLQFHASTAGGVVTAIDPSCTFKDRLAVGDWLMTIDGAVVAGGEELTKNNTKVRIFGIAKRKASYHSTYLSMERVARLESIGFGWVGKAPAQKRTWDESFELLKRYKDDHGRWPTRREKWEDIGEFIHMQRKAYTQKKKMFMEERAPKLDEIGFPWVIRKASVQISWEDHMQRLTEFHRVNRHFNIPSPEGYSVTKANHSGSSDELRFYRWFTQLNHWYRAFQNGSKNTRLNQDRINQLEALGYKFQEGSRRMRSTGPRPVPELPFEQRLEQVQRFLDDVGHLDIDPRYNKCNNLGGWAEEISLSYKRWKEGSEAISSETERQFEELSSLGFGFNIVRDMQERTWDDYFQELIKYKQAHGHCMVPQMYKADVRLGSWVTKQRQEYRQRTLSRDRYRALNDSGLVWDVKKEHRYPIAAAEECSEERVSLGIKSGDYCRMCYRHRFRDVKSAERQKKCNKSCMGCAKCQEPICKVCWDGGYDRHEA